MTVFSVQHFLEDHFEQRGLADIDQYAVRVANAFERIPADASVESVAHQIGRIHTAFFRRNPNVERKDFERQLASTLLRRFKKKDPDPGLDAFERALTPIRRRLRARHRSIKSLLAEFALAVEARGLDAFWTSRKNGVLRAKPEKIAQALLAVFAKGVLGNDGLVLREVGSGIGFVDIGISFGRILHLVELKVLKTHLTGAGQLGTYMRTERRKEGWLLLIDVRQARRASATPRALTTSSGRIRIVRVNANPPPPCKA